MSGSQSGENSKSGDSKSQKMGSSPSKMVSASQFGDLSDDPKTRIAQLEEMYKMGAERLDFLEKKYPDGPKRARKPNKPKETSPKMITHDQSEILH